MKTVKKLKKSHLAAKKQSKAGRVRNSHSKAKVKTVRAVEVTIGDLGYTLAVKPSKPDLSPAAVEKWFMSSKNK